MSGMEGQGLPATNTPFSATRVKSSKFGGSAKFGRRLKLFHNLIIGIKNQLSKQTMKILMTAHKETSHLDFQCLQMYVYIYLMSEVTRLYPICAHEIMELTSVTDLQFTGITALCP